MDIIIEPILFLWKRIFTFYYTRVRPQCDYSILGQCNYSILGRCTPREWDRLLLRSSWSVNPQPYRFTNNSLCHSRWSVNPQPERFANNSLSHSRTFLVCLPFSMSLCRVYMFSSLPVFLPVLRALRVLCSVIPNHLGVFFVLFLQI